MKKKEQVKSKKIENKMIEMKKTNNLENRKNTEKIDLEILNILLKDHTTNKNIIWATDNYKDRGQGYNFEDQIELQSVTGYNGNIIKPRMSKSKKEQEKRIKYNAEVFTPSWVCNSQNNLVDNSWAGEANFFNTEIENGWIIRQEKIKFPTLSGKTWMDYIKDTRLEITCGEAPYLVSRYDNVSGEIIKIEDRIGLLDRKIRVINENIDEQKEWNKWVEIAYQNIYGYEYQGDNLLIARKNLLYDYIDNYKYKFNEEPKKEEIKKIAEIISWNIWQMDGLKFVVPNSCKNEKMVEMTLFGEEIKEYKCSGCNKNISTMHNGQYCIIKDWKTNKKNKFVNIIQ